MALDDYVTLGRSGLRVSPLCPGRRQPEIPFPQRLQPFFPAFLNGATSVNGSARVPSPIIGPGVTPY